MNKNSIKPISLHKLIVCSASAIAVVLLAVLAINRTALRDIIRSMSFEKSEAISTLESQLGLTDRARITFEASFPSLDASNIFNDHCATHDADHAVLGCFTEEKIYIYDVKSEDLDGVVQSTAAHELLHAAWSRLSGREKNQLATALEQSYHDNCATLCDTISTYAKEDQLDEIHSRLGTQIADLPPNLERYYAKYFTDRASIVSFYQKYSGVFTNIKSKIDTLSKELTAMKESIDSDTASYTTQVQAYAAKVNKFNSCAATAGCFSSSTFTTERKKLVTEYNNLDVMFSKLNIKISEYNNKVSEYNNTLIYGQKIENLINSNSAPAEI